VEQVKVLQAMAMATSEREMYRSQGKVHFLRQLLLLRKQVEKK
jgi:hypothetical protein